MLCDGKITNVEFYKTRDQIAAKAGLSLRTRKTESGGMAMKRPAAAAEPAVAAKRTASSTANLGDLNEIPAATENPTKRPAAAANHEDDDEGEEPDDQQASTDSDSELGMGDPPVDESYFDFSKY